MAISRTSVQLGEARGPSAVQAANVGSTQLPTPDNSGIEALRGTFTQFFGGVADIAQGMENAEAAQEKRNLYREWARQDEAERQQWQRDAKERAQKGQADALAGAEMNPEASGYYSYLDAYGETKGQLVGSKAADDFRIELEKAPFDADAETIRTTWAEEQFAGGTGDPTHDSAMLAAFKRKTDEVVVQHKLGQIKQQKVIAIDAAVQNVAGLANSGELSVDNLRESIAATTALMGGDAVKARGAVWSAAMSAVQSPEGFARVASLLNTKGYTDDGKSFSEAFPDAARDIEQKMTGEHLRATSHAEETEYLNIRNEMLDPSKTTTSGLLGLIARVADWDQKYGGGEKALSLKGELLNALQKGAEKDVGMHNFEAEVASGMMLPTQKDLNEHMGTFLQKHGGDPWGDGPAADTAARLIRQAGGMHTQLKDSLAATLNNDNPDIVAKGFAMWRRLEDLGYDVKADLGTSGGNAYEALKMLMTMNAQNPGAAISQFQANRKLYAGMPTKASEMDWPTLTGQIDKRPAEVRAAVTTEIHGNLAKDFGATGWFGRAKPENLTISPDIANELTSVYGRTLGYFQAQGMGDRAPEAAMAAVRDSVKRDYASFQNANGEWRLVPRSRIPSTDAEGKPVVAPGIIMGANGKPEDTREIFKQDMANISASLPDVFSAKGTYYGLPSGEWVSKGAFPLMDSDTAQPLRLAPGQSVTIAGKATTLAKDPAIAAEQIRAMLPEHFVIQPLRGAIGLPPVFEIGYKFHGTPGATLEQRASQYDAKNADPAARKQEIMDAASLMPRATMDDYYTDLRDKALADAQLRGGAPETLGVTKPQGAVRSAQELVDQIFTWGKQQYQRRGAAAYDRTDMNVSDSYSERRYMHLKAEEGVRTTAYDDATGKPLRPGVTPKGHPTVGIGFNLDRPDAPSVLNQVLGLGRDAFEAIKSGAQKLNDLQVRKLLDHTITEAENIVDTRLKGVNLTENQRVALVSMAFNGPALIGPRLIAAAKAGDHKGVAREILSGKQAVLAGRRYREAALYLGNDRMASLPALSEYMARFNA
jgi:GH24 family phage-related lysozyme (muramidase)